MFSVRSWHQNIGQWCLPPKQKFNKCASFKNCQIMRFTTFLLVLWFRTSQLFLVCYWVAPGSQPVNQKSNPWRFTHLGHCLHSSKWSLSHPLALFLSPPTRHYPYFFVPLRWFLRHVSALPRVFCSFCRLQSGCDSVRCGWMPCLHEDFLACSGRWSSPLCELTVVIL